MIYHKNLGPDQMHLCYAFVYNSETERINATGFNAEDVGKLARQTDDNSLWLFVSTTYPPGHPEQRWVRAGGVGLASDGLGGVYVNPDINISGLDINTSTGELKHPFLDQVAGSYTEPTPRDEAFYKHYANEIMNHPTPSADDHVMLTVTEKNLALAGGEPATTSTLGVVKVPPAGALGGFTCKGGIDLVITDPTYDGSIWLKKASLGEIGGVKVDPALGFELDVNDKLKFSSQAASQLLGTATLVQTFEVTFIANTNFTTPSNWQLPAGWSISVSGSDMRITHTVPSVPCGISILATYTNVSAINRRIINSSEGYFYFGVGLDSPGTYQDPSILCASGLIGYGPFKLFIQFPVT